MSVVSVVVVAWWMQAAPASSQVGQTQLLMEPSWSPARVALARGDGASALSSLTADAPAGLRARALLAAGRKEEACALALPPSLGSQFHRLRCAVLGLASTSNAAATQRHSELGAEAVVVMRQAPALFVADEERLQMTLALLHRAPPTVREAMAAALVERPASLFDRAARARLASLLQVFVDEAPGWRLRAATRLVLELPEHARLSDREIVGPLDAAARVALATTLERQHDTEGVLNAVAGLTKTHCEAALLVGKSERKRKRFAAARAALQSATSSSCPVDVQKKAAFLEVRIAAVAKGVGAETLAVAFVDRWGSDPLVDDVLLWLAEIRSGRGDDDGAAAALSRLVNEHPDGDMVDEARFRLAMHKASRGHSVDARALLDQSAKRTTGQVSVMDHDRARYWSARLQAAPSPTSWDAGSDVVDGVVALRAFAAERPASYYGRLASLAAVHVVGNATKRTFPKDAPKTETTVTPAAVVTIPPTLLDVAAFRDALACAEDGFDDDAAILLGEVAIGRGQLDIATALAAAFVRVGRADLGHRAMRDRGFAVVGGAPSDPSQAQAFTLGWPRAFADELDAAATAHGVAPLLLSGLSREESAFDPHVVSWAGAVGLCQLMPATAADEAAQLKLAVPTPERLVDPVYNARLGAAHLGRRLRGLGHPLKAIAAYNAGPGAVLKWTPAAGARIPVDLWVERIPFDETRNYVKKVTNSWVTYSALAGDPMPTFALELTGVTK